jgi:hypothetical protein
MCDCLEGGREGGAVFMVSAERFEGIDDFGVGPPSVWGEGVLKKECSFFRNCVGRGKSCDICIFRESNSKPR